MNMNGVLIRLIPLGIGLIAMLFMVAKGCQQGPFGRPQIVRLTPEQEIQIGKQANEKTLSESKVLRNEAIVDRVRAIGRRLASASHQPEIQKILHINKERPYEWEYNVVDSKQVNAFCLPGGKVVVFTGILPIAETDAGLAVVMGHEIGHALARHGAERMAQSEVFQVGQLAVASSLGGMDPQKQNMVFGLFGAGAQYGVLLPFSRSHESEADHLGLILMSLAGYDPREAPKFWVRMSKATGGKRQSEFLSTHPNPETRSRDLQKWSDEEALSLFQKNPPAPSGPLPGIGVPSTKNQAGSNTSTIPSKKPSEKSNRKGKDFEFE